MKIYVKMNKKEGKGMIKVLFTGCTFNGEIIEKLKEKNIIRVNNWQEIK